MPKFTILSLQPSPTRGKTQTKTITVSLIPGRLDEWNRMHCADVVNGGSLVVIFYCHCIVCVCKRIEKKMSNKILLSKPHLPSYTEYKTIAFHQRIIQFTVHRCTIDGKA